MTTITRENAEIKSFITGFLSDPAHDNQSTDSLLANVFRIALASLEAEPVAWRYRYVKKGVTDSQGDSWVGDWKYVPTKEDCNDRPNYEIQALFTAPPVPLTSKESDMTTMTKERLLTIKQWRETYGPGSNVVLPAEEAEELARIALASLEAEPVAYIFKHPAGKLFWALTDESNKEQADVIPVYAAAPASVVPDNASEPLAYAYKELTPEIMRNHLAVFERYGIAPNDSTTTIQALRIALDGIERSDAMLQGKGG